MKFRGDDLLRFGSVALPGDSQNLAEFRAMAQWVKSWLPHKDPVACSDITKRIVQHLAAAPEVGSAAEASANEQLIEIMRSLSAKGREDVYHELDLMQKIADLREKIALNTRLAAEERAKFDAMLPEFNGKWLEVVRRSKVVPLPPTATTPNNLEALVMAYAYATDPVTHFTNLPSEEHESAAAEAAKTLMSHLGSKTPPVRKIMQKIQDTFGHLSEENKALLDDFCHGWLRSGFAKLEVGHKLAASLAMTDVPDDIEVHAPWKCWSLVVPPGLFGDHGGGDAARYWCIGTTPIFQLTADGHVDRVVSDRAVLSSPEALALGSEAITITVMMLSLVRGACLALSNPDDYKKQKMGSGTTKPQRPSRTEPDFGATRFLLSAPITIDMRQHVLDAISGKKHGGGSPTVQFLVRGHWRNQAHGPGRSLRKQIRIEPFWKGNEDARVLLRNYKVKEDDTP